MYHVGFRAPLENITDNVLSYRFLKNSVMEFMLLFLVLTFDERSRHYMKLK